MQFDGSASDIPDIPDDAISAFRQPIIIGALVTLAVTVAVGATALIYLRRNAPDRLALWLLFGIAAVVNSTGALLLTARPFLAGNDAIEVIRGSVPVWPLALATALWLAQLVMCLAAAVRSTRQQSPSGPIPARITP